jgi:hypothetical protein
MKKPSQIVIAACCLLIAVIVEAQTNAPEAFLPETQHQFGTVVEGEIVRHDFILLNKGSTNLSIEKIKTG